MSSNIIVMIGSSSEILQNSVTQMYFHETNFCYSSDSLTKYLDNDDYLPVEPRNNTVSLHSIHGFVSAKKIVVQGAFFSLLPSHSSFVCFSVSFCLCLFRLVSSSSSSSSRNSSNSSFCKTRGSSHQTCGSRLTLNRYTQTQHITQSFVTSSRPPSSC